ncbi:hypothetical protein JYT79_02160 [Cardiobacterium sp. AH-315-I02]|nr:hypothetical protein [Cardiobacterium sp. AH-315-I02]
MKIIRWLLSHTFLILLIVAVIYGYMFWGNLAGENTPAGKAISYLSNEFEGVSKFVAATKSKQESLSQQSSPEIESSGMESSKTESLETDKPSPENDVTAVVESVDSGAQTPPIETQATAETQVTEDVAENNNFTAPADSSMPDVADIEVTTENSNEDIADIKENTRSLETNKLSPENDVTAVVEPSVDGEAQTLPVETQTSAEKQVIEVVAEKNNLTAPVADSDMPDVAAIEVITENSNEAIENIKENTSEDISIEQQQVSISYNDNQGHNSQDHNNRRVKQNAAAIIETTAEPLARPLNIAVAEDVQSMAEPGDVPATINVAQTDNFVTPQIEKQLDNVDKHGKVINSSHQDDDIKANWIIARKSFYQRDYALSEKMYQSVIDNTEDNYDAYGELGNVYFNQRKNELAAAAYYEAAVILVNKGQARRARSLVGLLRSLDKSKADELQKLMESNPS